MLCSQKYIKKTNYLVIYHEIMLHLQIMAKLKDKEKFENYESEIVSVIKENKIFLISDIFAFYPRIRKSQFYNLNLEKSEFIKVELDNNKVLTKHSLRMKWLESDNATLQIAIYKLICNKEELERITNTYQFITPKENKPSLADSISKLSTKEIKEFKKLVKKMND